LSRKPADRIADMRHCCEKILKFTSGMDQDRFAEDELVTDAVLHNIEIIGEATKNLPTEIQSRMSVIEWRKIAGMRDMISHAYFQIDPGIVWDVVETKIPELLRAIEAYQEDNPP